MSVQEAILIELLTLWARRGISTLQRSFVALILKAWPLKASALSVQLRFEQEE